MEFTHAVTRLATFRGRSLTKTIAMLGARITGGQVPEVVETNEAFGIDQQMITAALTVKQLSAQIDVLVHASLIMYVLPNLLQIGEQIEKVSLGADTSESEFDLVTDQQIAEFKFILWQERGNAVREITLFRDFFKLAREHTEKKKYLYVLNSRRPLRFLNGKRSISGALASERLYTDFVERYGDEYATVGAYYRTYQSRVEVVDLAERFPELHPFAPL